METECHVDGIVVTVRFASAITGAIYIKDHFSTCRSEFQNVTRAILNIELPSLRYDNPPCPAEEIVSLFREYFSHFECEESLCLSMLHQVIPCG